MAAGYDNIAVKCKMTHEGVLRRELVPAAFRSLRYLVIPGRIRILEHHNYKEAPGRHWGARAPSRARGKHRGNLRT
jgi:hypothetical protein